MNIPSQKVAEKIGMKLYKYFEKNNKSEYLTNNSFVLFEFIDGETFIRFDEEMTLIAIKKIKELSDSLKLINKEINFKIENDWDKIRENKFLLDDASERIITLDISEEWKELILECINYLKENSEVLNSETYQLVHIDLGPDNFLVKDKNIISILDFSPANNLELMSLAHFIYWNYFWFEIAFSKEKLNEYLRVYFGGICSDETEKILEISLVIACLYRVIGLLLDMENQGSISISRLEKRINILYWTRDYLINR